MVGFYFFSFTSQVRILSFLNVQALVVDNGSGMCMSSLYRIHHFGPYLSLLQAPWNHDRYGPK